MIIHVVASIRLCFFTSQFFQNFFLLLYVSSLTNHNSYYKENGLFFLSMIGLYVSFLCLFRDYEMYKTLQICTLRWLDDTYLKRLCDLDFRIPSYPYCDWPISLILTNERLWSIFDLSLLSKWRVDQKGIDLAGIFLMILLKMKKWHQI